MDPENVPNVTSVTLATCVGDDKLNAIGVPVANTKRQMDFPLCDMNISSRMQTSKDTTKHTGIMVTKHLCKG